MLSVSFIAVPAFVVALYSLLIFAVKLQWFPAIGAGEPGKPERPTLAFSLAKPSPSACRGSDISLGWCGLLCLKSSAKDIYAPPVPSAYPERWITYRYALRLAILPTITVIGVGMGFLLSAAVFAEIVFARPGLGKLVIDSITTRNYPVVMGAVVVSTVVFVASTTISDLINAMLDPRIRQSV